MLKVQTVFLTPSWGSWKKEFAAFVPAIQAAAPSDEEGWVSVGERPDSGGIFVTIERQKATMTMSGWAAGVGSEPGTWRYEHKYETSDPPPRVVADDIRKVLNLPPSQPKKKTLS